MGISPVGAQNAAQILLQTPRTATPGGTAASSSRRSETADPKTSLLEFLDQQDEEQAKTLRDKQAEAQQAIGQLETGQSDPNKARKAAAAEKIARLKAELQSLRMLAASNPEAAARRAAALARELAAAVRQYASASGGGGAAASMAVGTGGGMMTATATASTTASSGPEASAANVAPTADGAASTPGLPPAPPVPTVASPAAPPSDTGPQDPAAASATTVTDGTQEGASGTSQDPEQTPEERAAALRATVDAQLAHIKRQGASRQQDETFAREAREILAALKSIIATAKRAMERDDDPENQDVKAAEKAVRDAATALDGLASGGLPLGMSGSVNVLI